MVDVAAFIEEELGLEITAEQRRIIEAMFPPPPPYVPPAQPWHRRAKRWFNRVVLRRKGPMSLTAFDKALKEHYAPGLRRALDQQTVLYDAVATRDGWESPMQKNLNFARRYGKGYKAVWNIKTDEGFDGD